MSEFKEVNGSEEFEETAQVEAPKKEGFIKRGVNYVGENWKPLGIGVLIGSLAGSITTAVALSRYEDDDLDDFDEDDDVQTTES